MARQERNSVDYFPFICKEGKAMYYIENKYSNDGFATWIKILRQLAVTNYHYLDLSIKVDLMFLSSKCRVSEQVLESIISDLVDLGEFDKTLWCENKIIWCQKLVDSIQDAYKKRNNKCMTYGSLLDLLRSLGVRNETKSILKGPGNPQRIVKDSKGEKEEKKFTPPTLLEVQQYFDEKGYTQTAANKAFDYYDSAVWKDSKGQKIKNWKQKMIGVWFRPEHEKPQKKSENNFTAELYKNLHK